MRLLLERKLNQINNLVSIYFRDHHEDIIKKKSLIFNNVSHFIGTELANILVSSQRISSAASFCFRGQKGELEEKERFVSVRVSQYMKRELGRIDDSFIALKKRSNSILQKAYRDTKFIEEKVNILSPGNVMRRGYSVSYKDNKLVRYSGDLKKGDRLKTVFFKGRAFSRVEETRGYNE